MDRERLGRVLGRGARLAARTAFEAVDAATSSPPTRSTRGRSLPVNNPLTSARPATSLRTGRTKSTPSVTLEAAPLLRAAKAAGKGFASPLRRASRALWLELTGCFFALFALSFGLGVWHTRATAFSTLPVERYRFVAFCLLTLVFAYFSISSFLRARRTSAGESSAT